MRTPTIITSLAIAAALGLSACTSTSGTTAATGTAPATAASTTPAASSTPAADTGKAALETAVRAYSVAYLTGHATTAYSLLSKRCTTRITKTEMTTLAKGAATLYGNVDIKSLTVDQLSGNLARVTYTYPVATLNQAGQPWTRENGAWHYDAC